jgi:hypothetical protein
LALLKGIEEPEPFVWFSWNSVWDFSCIPHPGTFSGGHASERMNEAFVRIGVPASVATLRWSDYLARNKTTRSMRDEISNLGNPADWLATD